MGQDLDEAKEILDVAAKAPGNLQVGFEYRYGTMTGRLKELQDLDTFGETTCIDIIDSRGHWWPDDPDDDVKNVWRLNPEIGGGPLLHCGNPRAGFHALLCWRGQRRAGFCATK